MKIELPDDTVRGVQAVLSQGRPESVAEFVDRAVRQRLLSEAIREAWRLNTGADPDEVAKLVDEELDAVRSFRTPRRPDAGRS
jgi:Arc/MetJ-type ribon-helix-helix transcriptional regulator